MHSCASKCLARTRTYAVAPAPSISPAAAAAATPSLRLHQATTAPVPRKADDTASIRGASICYYTSLPERMGEQETPQPHQSDEQREADEARRQSDAATQDQALRVLRAVEAAAVTANPEAGHPENRRMLSTVDYPAPEPPETPHNSPVHSVIHDPTTGINWYVSSIDAQGSGVPVEGGPESNMSGAKPSSTAKSNDSIYDDNAPFVAWFEDP